MSGYGELYGDDLSIRCDFCEQPMPEYTTTGACLDCDIKWLASHQLEDRKRRVVEFDFMAIFRDMGSVSAMLGNT